jgi:hypothetical protein
MKSFGVILVVLLIALTSCEKEAQLTYKITNTASSDIKVICQNTAGKVVPQTFIIATNNQTIIAVNGEGISRVSNCKETGDTLRNFIVMDIYKYDTLKSAVNFLKTQRWRYNEINNHQADYVLTVTDSDF